MSDPITQSTIVGQVAKASTINHITVRIWGKTPIEKLQLGAYVTVRGQDYDYICKVVEVASREIISGTTDSQVFSREWGESNIRMKGRDLDVKTGRITYELTLEPLKALPQEEGSNPSEPQTIPPLLSEARPTTAHDIERLYTDPEKYYVTIGHLRGMTPGQEVEARVDLDKLQTLHGAVFAKTGSGKTYLARILAGHVVARPNGCALIFDMHGEYGYGNKGLKPIFPEKVKVFSLDPKSEVHRRDHLVRIPYKDITVNDCLLAVDASDTQVETLFRLEELYDDSWLATLMDEGKQDDILEKTGGKIKEDGSVTPGEVPRRTITSLRRKVRTRVVNLPCMEAELTDGGQSSLQILLDYLLQAKTVVVNFGNYSNDPIVYALITNIIARRLFEIYQSRFRTDSDVEQLPYVTLLIEEAHKFLNKTHINASFFGQFIREARKFRLSLLIVDQRPSQIYEDVLSQIGTIFLMRLTNEQDVRSIIKQSEEGLSDYEPEIRRLNTQEALVAGQASDFVQSVHVLTHDVKSLTAIWTGQAHKAPGQEVLEDLPTPPQDGF